MNESIDQTEPVDLQRQLDPLAREVATTFCDGAFEHVQRYDELDITGDTLFRFAVLEVTEAGGDREEAVRMLRAAARHLEEVAQALEQG